MNKLLSILLISATCLFANNIQTAKELFDEKKDYKEAIQIFEKFQNDPEAEYYLGKAYYYGLGVEKNDKIAFKHAQKSTSANNPSGINLLGVLYAEGNVVNKDVNIAIELYTKAAKLGSVKAIGNLGNLYSDKSFQGYDIELAIEYYKKAIAMDDRTAYGQLAVLYIDEKRFQDELNLILKFELKHPDMMNDLLYNELGRLYNYDIINYPMAYAYYLKATQLGSYKNTWLLYDMVREKKVDFTKKEEAVSLLEKAADSSINKDPESLKMAQLSLYGYYLYDSNQSAKALKLATSAYQNGNINMGCKLALYYSNLINQGFDLEKSYDIATKIIAENKRSNDTLSCYDSLADMYRMGNYVAKDARKSLELNQNTFDNSYDKKNYLYSRQIAELYMEDLKDFDNAQKWFQKTYDLTKDASYLTKVDEYKKSLPVFTDKDPNKEEQVVYPIIENFYKKEQVASFLESKKYYFLATDQKSIRIYDKSTLSLIKELRGWIGKGGAGIVLQMAFDENKGLLYCAGINSDIDLSKNDLIKVFDIASGRIIKTLVNSKSGKSIYLNITEDGKYLISINNNSLLQIINTSNNEHQFYDFSNIVNFTYANIVKAGDDYVGKALGNDGNIYSFSVNQKRQISKEPFRNQTTFKAFNGIHAQGIFKDNVDEIFGVQLKDNDLLIQNKNSDKTKIFNLKNLTLSSTSEPKNINESHSKTSIILKPVNENRTLEIYQNDKKLSSIELLYVNALSYKVINDKYIIVTTSDISAMYIFNLQGRAIARLSGFLSLQKHLIYQDNYLVTYGDDNIIHLWNIDNLDQLNQSKEAFDQEILKGFYKLTGGNVLEMLEDDQLDDNFFELQGKQNGWSFKPTKEQLNSYMKMLLVKKEEKTPLASLYIKKDEWIAFDHNGLFASSPKGTDLIRYHQNQGLDKEAKIIDNTQIFEKFYRPDLIKKKLAKQAIQVDMDIRSVIQSINPPLVEILTNKFRDSKNLDITYKICDSGSGISNTTLILNGIGATPNLTRGFSIEKSSKAHEACQLYKNTITLKNGENTIAIKSFDANQTISSTSKEVTVNAQYSVKDQANLYFVSIAVTDYKNATLNLKFPVNDVVAVKKKIEQKSKTLFKNIFSYQLHDHEMTATNFDRLFTDLSKKIDANDVLIVYIAGHGITSDKDGLYYFYPYDISDTSPNELAKQAISVNNIKSQLHKIQAQKSLILFDTCNSGSVLDNLDQKIIGDRLSQDNSRNFIVASSKGQAAIDGYNNHGVFSYAVLDAFDKAYFGNQVKLTPTTLAGYVESEVPRISQEIFHYEQTPQKYLNGIGFDIGIK